MKLKLCVFLLLFLNSLLAFGDSAIPKEDFEVAFSPTMKFLFKANKQYPIISQKDNTYIVKYETMPGIFDRLEILKSKVNFLSAAEKEKTENEQKKAEQDYREQQKAKGFIEVEGFWVSEEFKTLSENFLLVNKMRDEVVPLGTLTKELEASLIAQNEYYTKLSEAMIKMQEKEMISSQKIEKERAKVNQKSSADVERFNKKVLAHNKLITTISKQILKLQKGKIIYDKKVVKMRASRQEYQQKLPDYKAKLNRLELDMRQYDAKVIHPEDEEFLGFLKEVVKSFQVEITSIHSESTYVKS